MFTIAVGKKASEGQPKRARRARGAPRLIAIDGKDGHIRSAPFVDLTSYRSRGVVRVLWGGRTIARLQLPKRHGEPVPYLRADEYLEQHFISKWADSPRKRTFDLVLGSLAMTAALPIMATVAAAILIEDGGPIFYTHLRSGRGGRPFRFLKFRSMSKKADVEKATHLKENESSDGVIFKMKADPRVTRVGSFIRKTSLDELPQFFHVLAGQMSLVGPRPHPVEEVADYDDDDMVRLVTKPGVTGLWQIMGRSELPFKQQMFLDKIYLRHQSLTLDLKVLFKTVPAVVIGRGAY